MIAKPANQLTQQQAQAQIQKLAMTQKMQQSLRVLQFNSTDLVDFLREQALDNPLITIKLTADNSAGSSLPTQANQTSEDKHQAFLAQLPAEKISLFDHLILQLVPTGIGASTLKDFLMLQTERNNHAPYIAYLLLEESFDQLVNHQLD